jgi:hypothetical protein
MGRTVAAILPIATLLAVIVAATRPLGDDSVILVVGVLAAAGIALTCCGWAAARTRRR